jgi:2'-5' RNA ligase
MNKKAIDIVLLPSEEMLDKAIAINRELLHRGEPKKMLLNKSDCLPHVSLLMGCVAEQSLPALSQSLLEIASRHAAFHLQVTEVQQEGNSTVLHIEKDGRLQELHESLIEQCAPYLSFDARAEMLYTPPEVGEISIQYINNFLKNASFTNYSPHITVGSGEYKEAELPIPFVAATLAICHLGNYCTCRELLFHVQLNSGG